MGSPALVVRALASPPSFLLVNCMLNYMEILLVFFLLNFMFNVMVNYLGAG